MPRRLRRRNQLQVEIEAQRRSLFKEFPLDVVRVIFEIAAAQDWSTAISLYYVSNAVRSWIHKIEPYGLYLKTKRDTERFSQMKKNGPSIRSLIVNGSKDTTAKTIGSLVNLEKLLIVGDCSFESGTTPPAILPLPRIIILLIRRSIRRAFYGQYWMRTFRCVSHLWMEDGLAIPGCVAACASLPSLTHLGFGLHNGVNEEIPDDIPLKFDQLLGKRPSLVILLHVDFRRHKSAYLCGDFWPELAEITEPERVFVRSRLKVESHIRLFMLGRSVWDGLDSLEDWRDYIEPRSESGD